MIEKRKVENEELDGLSAEEVIDLLYSCGYGQDMVIDNPEPVNKKSGFDYVCCEVYCLRIDNEIVDRKVIKECLKVVKREVDSVLSEEELQKVLTRPIIIGTQATPLPLPNPKEEIWRAKEYFKNHIEKK